MSFSNYDLVKILCNHIDTLSKCIEALTNEVKEIKDIVREKESKED